MCGATSPASSRCRATSIAWTNTSEARNAKPKTAMINCFILVLMKCRLLDVSSVRNDCLPHGQADDGESTRNADPHADFFHSCDSAQPSINPGPHDHGRDDEPRAQDGKSEGEQLQPAE